MLSVSLSPCLYLFIYFMYILYCISTDAKYWDHPAVAEVVSIFCEVIASVELSKAADKEAMKLFILDGAIPCLK